MQAIVELELWEEATTLPFRVEVAKTATVEDIRKNLESTAPLRFLDSGGDGWRPLNEKNLQRMLSSSKVIVATKAGTKTYEGITLKFSLSFLLFLFSFLFLFVPG